MSVAGAALGLAALGCVAGAALADIRHFEIPDGWSIVICALFAAFAVVEVPPVEWWPHLAAGAAVFVAGAGLFALGWWGGGDVKLLSACAVWSGLGGLPQLLAGTLASGAVLALAALVGRRVAGGASDYPALVVGGPLPYAVAILGGSVTLAFAAL